MTRAVVLRDQQGDLLVADGVPDRLLLRAAQSSPEAGIFAATAANDCTVLRNWNLPKTQATLREVDKIIVIARMMLQHFYFL